MGLMPDRPVAALRESVTSVQRLLAGETVTLHGKQFTLEEIGITHPATEDVRIMLGVMGPMLLQLAGQIADRTLFGAAAGVDYFRWAQERVAIGLAKAGRPAGAMSYETIALACVDRDGARARATARPILASFLGEFGVNALTDAYGISEELTAILAEGGAEAVEARMPDRWLEDLTLVGDPAEVAAKMEAWLAAGLDSICVFLPHESEDETLRLIAEDVIPRLDR